jgi:hypothetical protein
MPDDGHKHWCSVCERFQSLIVGYLCPKCRKAWQSRVAKREALDKAITTTISGLRKEIIKITRASTNELLTERKAIFGYSKAILEKLVDELLGELECHS